MKSYNGLWDRMLDHEEIKQAIIEAARGKTGRRTVKNVLANLDQAADCIAAILQNGWTPKQHARRTIREGGHRKTRDNIQKPAWWPEQIIHHLIVRQLKPIIIPRMYENVCGTISRQDQAMYKHAERPRGKGAVYAVKKMEKWRDEYKGKKFYVLATDIKSFYDSIDINILFGLISRRIRDKRFLDLVWAVLESAGPGIPKGFYTSPWFAQIMLETLDTNILEHKYGDHYLRYMDNIFILGTNKRKLRRARDEIGQFLRDNLHLRPKGSTQVYRFEHPKNPHEVAAKGTKQHTLGRQIECLGFIIHNNRITIRKNILKRIRAKAARIQRKGRMTCRDASALTSYKGWLKHTATHGYYVRHIKRNADLATARRILRRRAKYGGTVENGALHRKTA